MDRRRFLLGIAAAATVCACDRPAEGQPGGRSSAAAARCANCGMRVAADSRWRAGVRGVEGRELVFDCPKCLFRWLRQEPGRAAHAPRAWAIEYYSQRERPASALHFVLGSDLVGPMGHDLIPIEGAEAAARFSREHHGRRVLSFAEVDAEVVAGLFHVD